MAKKGKSQHVTPAMRQFHRFKKQYPGTVLFFRMGDFYEMFYEDAELAHKTLGVTLTQRTKGIPMAGVPYHAVEGYLRRMIQAGHRVAVCDQIQDPAEAKGVVERDVTRVITPGTLTDESLLDEGQENPLAAIVFHGAPKAKKGEPEPAEQVSLAWAELSTGAFAVTTLPASDAGDELARIGPSELLYCETATGEVPPRVKAIADSVGCTLTGRPAWQLRQNEASEVLRRQYQVASLGGFGFEDDDPALTAASAVLHYLLETQRTDEGGRLGHLRPPRRFERTRHLIIDQTSLRSLEVEQTLRSGGTEGSLLDILRSGSACVTAMGKRMLRQWLCYPLCDREPIEARQRVVQALVDDSRFLEELRGAIDGVHDVERITARLAVGRATPRDLVGLGRSAACIETIENLLAERPAVAGYFGRAVAIKAALAELAAQIDAACVESPPAHLREGGLIKDGYDAQLDEYRSLQRDSHAWLAQYQKDLIEQTDLPALKVGYNKVFGYYIEISAANRHKVQDDDERFAAWTRKQTLKNAERYITPDLKEFEGKVLSAESRAVSREQDLFARLSAAAAAEIEKLHELAQLVGEVDVLGAFAHRAKRHRYVRPEFVDAPVLAISAGRHPVLDELLGDQFVPNDVMLAAQAAGGGTAAEDGEGKDASDDTLAATDEPATLALITGPNMAGKSTYIRQTALIALLAHTGSFVPAERVELGLCDRIFTRIGASDELHTGQSTFMVEMTETANICHHATDRSLVILDEIGRGTSTLDGLSLAWAIAEHLAAKRPRCLFATHYHELTQLAEQYANVANLNVLVREWQDQIVFLHRIVPGATDRSYGIHVAKIAGLPSGVVSRAHELLGQLAVSHEGQAPRPAPAPAPAAPPAGQMGLFTEVVMHPAVARLQELDLNELSPLAAFDILRQIQSELAEE